MRGKIKFFVQDRGFGMIAVDGQADVFFHFSNVKDAGVRCTQDEPVEFDAIESKKKPGTLEATNIKLVSGFKHEAFRLSGHPSTYLFQWGYIQVDDFLDPSGRMIRGVLHELERIALKEDWAYGDNENTRTPFPILKSYLINTFFKLYKDGAVSEVSHGGKNWAAFNTGLVDDRYDPIFALYEQNDRPPRPWKFYAFCRPNIGRDGQVLARNFNPLPSAPKYFEKAGDVIFDPDTPIQPRYDHIVYDSIEKDRYPIEFLKKHVPAGLEWKDLALLDKSERSAYLKAFREGLEKDARTDRDIRNRIDDAIALAVKRARWNFKTAIPLYYPKANAISLLLPIALVDDDQVDLALVVSRTAAGGYSGETVYKLKWAYDHARLVCRPDSDWLTPKAGDFSEEDEDGTDEGKREEFSLELKARSGELPSVPSSDALIAPEVRPAEPPPIQDAKKEGASIFGSIFGRRT